MRKIMAGLILVLGSMQVASARGQSAKYPSLSEYMMTPEAEVALARKRSARKCVGARHCQDTYGFRIQGRHPG